MENNSKKQKELEYVDRKRSTEKSDKKEKTKKRKDEEKKIHHLTADERDNRKTTASRP